MTNPLVAPTVDVPVSPWAGVWLADDVESIRGAVQDRSWAELSVAGASASLDVLAFVADPFGSLLQYGIAWMIEHVRPLAEALDWLAGDPAAVAAQTQTWRNVAGALRDNSDDLIRAVRWDTTDWEGEAGDAYRAWSANQQNTITALAHAADTMAVMTDAAATLIAGVRQMVRDAIAVVVAHLIDYAIEELASLGAATAVVANQAAALCAAWSDRISRWIRDLLASLRNLATLGDRLKEALEAIKTLLRRLTGSGDGIGGAGGGFTRPSGKPDPGRQPRGRRTDAHPIKKADRGLRRENEAADVLAAQGFDVEQNPPPNAYGKKPDYRIEGEYFDCYAPSTSDLDNIRDQISDKVKSRQADRIVLNLDDCPRSLTDIRGVLMRKPVTGLNEILVIQGGEIVRFFPFS
ncbi:hypothetical protein ODJ79_03700 [Actinoplanes sp. KI2]|uniref:CdiA C-terminal domain-containing protein n=1 Tax=Actinoplanes sp. KI2 TaxID=2983315 RepID=UPI0021D5D72F|nr:hypothetical protein [Actinoplanes sp. KI2]MCU7722809.1 hypothetical protein [Actinoplanes sp. KI2]